MRAIIKQTSWLFLAQTLGRIIGFIYTIFLARNLGVSDFGLYSTALAYFSLISSVADFGFNRFLVKEVASSQQKIPELISGIGFLRLTFSSILFAVFALFLYFFDPDKMRVTLILLSILAILPQSIALTFDAVFVALQKLQYSALALIFLNFSTSLLGFFLVSQGMSVTGAIVALLLGQSIYLLVLVFLFCQKKLKFLASLNTKVFKEILKGSYIYGILGVIGLASFKIDTIFLAYFKGNYETGIYTVAYKFLETTSFIPVALSTALFPVLARLHQNNKLELKKVYFNSLKILFMISILISLIFIFILPIFIEAFLPSYSQSVGVLKILALAIPFIFLHIPSAQVILSTDKFLKNSLIIFTTLICINIILYLIFIPMYGFLGASWVTVFSEFASLTAFFIFIKVRVFK